MVDNKEASQGFYPERRPIALFVDIDNLASHLRDEGAIAALLNALKPWGNVVIRKAFGNSFTFKHHLYQQLLHHKFELVNTVNWVRKKNSTDIRIAVEIMELVHTRRGVNTFAIASGDSG